MEPNLNQMERETTQMIMAADITKENNDMLIHDSER